MIRLQAHGFLRRMRQRPRPPIGCPPRSLRSRQNGGKLVPSMSRSAKVGWFVVTLCSACVCTALGQIAPPKPVPALPDSSSELGNEQRWFQLVWPSLPGPVTYSWNATATPSYEMLRWPTYDWNAILGHIGALSLQMFNRVQPAIELDCRSTLCIPMLEATLGLESRLNLGGRGRLPDNYLFLRRENVQDSVRNYQRLRLGIGGLLDL